MKKKVISIITGLMMVATMSLGLTSCGQADDSADSVIYSNFYTEEGGSDGVEAVAVKDGVITFAGSKEDAEAFIGDSTETVDYSDAYALPGLIDGHCHTYVAAENTISDFQMNGAKDQNECVQRIEKFIKENPDKDFYIGSGWLDSMFENDMPTAELLDKIDTDKPIYLKSEDCHSCWTNTAMMKLCEITKDTPDPAGGVVEHYANGEPAGCFRDTAMDLLIKPHVPTYTVDQYKDILDKQMNKYIAMGYTAYNDVLIDVTSADTIVEAYHQLDQEGKLKAYVTCTYVVNNDENAEENVKHIKELADSTKGEHFDLNGVKFFMDGITESCTSYLEKPYKNDKENYGVDRWAGEEGTQRLYDAATLCNDLGLIAHFHAIGDAGVKKGLDAAEYVKAHTENPDIRNAMTHIELMDVSDIPRFKELDMIASCDFGWCYTDCGAMYDDPNYENIEFKNLGEDRVFTEEMRYKSILDTGAKVAFATDFPATPNVDPFFCMEIGNTRTYDSVKGSECIPEEALSVPEELKAMTETTAYQLYRENDFGAIKEGMKANFVIVDQDVTTVKPAKISDTKVMETFIDGVSAYAK
ncbi:MAG: amidohydrolase [Eubacterium sp.]|nr:amidohydrolase [Candidatus Colimonas fimequi]